MPVPVPSPAPRTLGDLKTRIADELVRADLSTQIALAISDAIEEASTHRFWFMEVRGFTFPLSAGVAQYTGDTIAGLIEIDRLKLVTDSQTYTLRLASDDDVSRWNDGTPPNGQPYAYSRYGDQITFYPTPRQAFSVTLDGLSKGTVLDNDTDSNIWTTTGERYVRALAKRNVLAEVIQDDERAISQDALARRFRDEFLAQTHARTATGEMACHA